MKIKKTRMGTVHMNNEEGTKLVFSPPKSGFAIPELLYYGLYPLIK
jgi:hypothetical protein